MSILSILKQPFRIFGSPSRAMSYIGTHSGKFHCDEAFACWMLKLLPEFTDHLILRTRNQADLEKCEIVVDVGGVFDHEKKRYDHHQRTFVESMRSLSPTLQEIGVLPKDKSLPYTTKLSSAGLIYAFYGKGVIKRILEKDGTLAIDDKELDFYYEILYKDFVESVDAIDNGINSHSDQSLYIIPVSLQSLVEELNPSWNEKNVSEDARFVEAMKVVGDIFTRKVLFVHNSWMPCRNTVDEAIRNRNKVHESGKILLLPHSCPWKKHFFMLEKEYKIEGQMIYVVYPGDAEKTNWRVQAIPVSEISEFDNRSPLPEAWRGKRDEELSAISGIKDATFVHATGFIGGAKEKNETIKMAAKSLEIAKL